MKTRARLLPHWCQVVGYSYLGAVNFTMFCLAAFSQEKVEDEMMQAFRLRTITIIAMIPILTHIVGYIAPKGSVAEDIALSIINDWMGDFGIIMIMYLILFKLMVWTNKWRMRNEE